MDRNLEALVSSSELYKEQEVAVKRLQLDLVKRNTQEMIASLKQRSELSRELQLKELKGMKTMNLARLFVGTKVDYMVLKYITSLKKRVLERQDGTAKLQTEKMIASIIKKLEFNRSLKNVAVERKAKAKKSTKLSGTQSQMKPLEDTDDNLELPSPTSAARASRPSFYSRLLR